MQESNNGFSLYEYGSRTGGRLITIGSFKTRQEAIKAAIDLVESRRFKVYYTRCLEEDGVIYIDYGSHVNFFKIYDKNSEQYKELQHGKERERIL